MCLSCHQYDPVSEENKELVTYELADYQPGWDGTDDEGK